MGRNKSTKKPVAKAKAASVTPIKKEVAMTPPKATSAELSKKIQDAIGDDAAGFAFVVAGTDGAIIPFAGAKSIGDLLLLKYVLEKEINRIVDSVAYPRPAEGDSAAAQ